MSIGYQLEQLKGQGKRDDAQYLAATTLDDVLAFYVEDGYTDDEINALVIERIADLREDS